MSSLHVVQILPDSNPHLQAFSEIADVVEASLVDLGHDVTRSVNSVEPDRRNIVLGGHVLSDGALSSLPPDTIIYNFEQIDGASMMPPARLRAHTGLTIWDYSAKNIAHWQQQGVAAVHVPLGFHPCLERLQPAADRPIDALFYGSMNERRRAVLDRLDREGIRAEALFGVYGQERDAAIQQSKLVLNIHYYETKILETARLSYLFANAIPVASEWSADLEIPEGLAEAAAFSGYDQLPERVMQLLEDPEGLARQGKAGAEAFAQMPMTEYLEAALEFAPAPRPATRSSSPTPPTRRVVFVLGCHRSGTSMVSRIVNLGGFELTGPAIAPAADNPAGFWEDQRIAILDDQILRVLGSRWDDIVPTSLAHWRQHPRLSAVHDDLVHHLGSSNATDLLVKDPRITVLFPMWKQLIDELGWEIMTTFVIRDPRAVAESLNKRNGFSRVKGIFIWLHHVLMGELHSRAVPRILIDYETLLRSIEEAAPKLHGALRMTTPLEHYEKAAVDHVTEDMNHAATYESQHYDFPAAALAMEVYDRMRNGATSQELDALRSRYLDAISLVGPLVSEFRGALAALTDRL